jgi:hypothetical protein
MREPLPLSYLMLASNVSGSSDTAVLGFPQLPLVVLVPAGHVTSFLSA